MPKFEIKHIAQVPDEPVKDSKTAMKAVLGIVFQHTADVFELIVDAVSEHYKIDKAEMMDVILKNPAYINKETNVIIDMGHLPEPKPKKKRFIVKKALTSNAEVNSP